MSLNGLIYADYDSRQSDLWRAQVSPRIKKVSTSLYLIGFADLCFNNFKVFFFFLARRLTRLIRNLFWIGLEIF